MEGGPPPPRSPATPMARGPGGSDHRWTMRRPAARSSAPPLIGVVTHELRAEPAPAWAAVPGRTDRDRAPARLSLRLTYTRRCRRPEGSPSLLPAHAYADDA